MLPTATIAQSGTPAPSGNPQGQALLWLGVMTALVIGAFVLVMWMRRRTLGDGASSDQDTTLMESLRAMRDRGEISQEEFEATRRAMRERLAASLRADSTKERLSNSSE